MFLQNTKRMIELVKSFSIKDETIKNNDEKHIDEAVIIKECKRLKDIARIDEWYGTDPVSRPTQIDRFKFVGHGKTVNTFIPFLDKMKNPEYTLLKNSEALSISIKRALESGTPINDISFYDEVNWNLNNMGFDSVLSVDIKNAILKMIR